MISKYIKYLCLLLLFLTVTAYFSQSRIYVHYDNVNNPIRVVINNYDDTRNHVEISNGTKMLIFKKSNIFTWHFTDDPFASLDWKAIEGDNETYRGLGILSEEGQPDFYSTCRLDVYLDKDANLIKWVAKDYLFLNFCW